MQHSKLMFFLLVLATILSSCQDEFGQDIAAEGVPVVAEFSYAVKEGEQIETRLAQDPSVERSVVQLFALAFDSDGALSGSGVVKVDGTGRFSLPMSSGNGKTLYLVANYDKGSGNLVDEEGNPVNLQDIQNLDDFRKVGYQYNEANRNQVDRSLFTMVGSISNFIVTTDGTVQNASVVYLDRISARITFNITAATEAGGELTDVTFEPYYYYVDNIPSGSYLVPRDQDWKAGLAENYSSMSGPEPEHRNFDVSSNTNSSFTFYLMENRLAPKKNITMNDKPADATLYSLRERRDRGAEVNNGDGQEYEQGPFTYAPEYGTYVVICGRVQGKQGPQGENPGTDVIADVRFTVHLGETGNAATETLVNDYNTRRNVNYTYNMSITGVHSMHVEVENDNEVRPGVEGDLILTGDGAYFNLDAHFNTVVFKVNLSQWSAENPPVSWAYSTPFGRAMKALNIDAFDENGNIKPGYESVLQTDLDNNDYKWIQFAINRECLEVDGNPAGSVVPYPGQQAYTGVTGSNQPAPALGGQKYNGVKLYDVNQLMNRLYQIYKKNEFYIETDGTVVVTAYIDEYLYTYDPTKFYYKAPGRETDIDNTLWKQSVNQNPRWLYLSTDSQFSPDGETTKAKAIVVFSQNPIYTIYDPNKVDSAWGTEAIVEDMGFRVSKYSLNGELSPDKFMKTDHPDFPNDRVNGYANTKYWLSGKRWADYIDYSQGLANGEKFKLASAMQSARNGSLQAAPLVRNRDFDGDGIIDDNELRWYLGAFNQLQGMVIGKRSIPKAQLYDESKYVSGGRVTLVHFASSTYIDAYVKEGYKAGTQVPIKVWGEEEGANGPSNGQGGLGGNHTGDYYLYRCMRNLGTTSHNEIPEDYVSIQVLWESAYRDGNGLEAVFDMSRLDVNSLRSPFLNTILPQGLVERDRNGNSRPTRKFAVLLRKMGTGTGSGAAAIYNLYSGGNGYGYLDNIRWIINNEGVGGVLESCPEGYRMPNHSEMLIMHAYNNLTAYDSYAGTIFPDPGNALYVGKSAFSYGGMLPYSNSSNAPYPGFVVNLHNVALASKSMEPNGYALKVRCVRDIQ